MFKFLKKNTQTVQKQAISNLFIVIVQKCTDPHFMKGYHISCNFETRFNIASLYFFIFHDFLQFFGKPLPGGFDLYEARRQLMDEMVNLLDISLREDGVSDMRIGKKIKEWTKKFYARLLTYDSVLSSKANNINDNDIKLALKEYFDEGVDIAKLTKDIKSWQLFLTTQNIGDILSTPSIIFPNDDESK